MGKKTMCPVTKTWPSVKTFRCLMALAPLVSSGVENVVLFVLVLGSLSLRFLYLPLYIRGEGKFDCGA